MAAHASRDSNTTPKDSPFYSEPSQPPDSTEPVILDRSSDLTVMVGTSDAAQARFLVSRKAMRLVSSVWDIMLDPTKPYVESSSNEVLFEEDDPNAFSVLLLIAHFQFKKLPQSLELEQLLHLAVLCDKYDMVSIVRLFLTAWVEPLKLPAQDPVQDAHADWLFIAYTFGFMDVFKGLVNGLVHNVETDEMGRCITSTGTPLDADMCDGIIAHILAARNNLIASLLALCYNTLNRLSTGDICRDASGNSKEECRVIQLGSLAYAMQSLSLWPDRKQPENMRVSVAKLTSSIEKIRIHYYPSDESNRSYYNNNYTRSHSGCSIAGDLRAEVQAVLREPPSAIEESHERHLQVQADK